MNRDSESEISGVRENNKSTFPCVEIFIHVNFTLHENVAAHGAGDANPEGVLLAHVVGVLIVIYVPGELELRGGETGRTCIPVSNEGPSQRPKDQGGARVPTHEMSLPCRTTQAPSCC